MRSSTTEDDALYSKGSIRRNYGNFFVKSVTGILLFSQIYVYESMRSLDYWSKGSKDCIIQTNGTALEYSPGKIKF